MRKVTLASPPAAMFAVTRTLVRRASTGPAKHTVVMMRHGQVRARVLVVASLQLSNSA